ncbi:MAG: transcription factor S [Candidatus Aenigmatarchaeota archaeon]|nr:MAG: transcription factor S [Candidatus Aenigmarchaeota archaeon]
MQFCEKCGSVLVAQKEKDKTILICRKCGFKLKDYKPLEISESVEKDPLDDVIIIEKNEETLPKTKTTCPKCGHNEAVWWIQQTRSADEAPTLFLRCTKCKHSWREYG